MPNTIVQERSWPAFAMKKFNGRISTALRDRAGNGSTTRRYTIGASPGLRRGMLPIAAVLVQPGYALDIQGREVIVSDPYWLTVPAQKISGGPETKKIWWVTASYRDAHAPREGDCSCQLNGVPLRRLPSAIVRWRDPEANDAEERLEPGFDVILATVEIERGDIVSITSIGRRSAVPPKRPYVYGGRTKLMRPPPEEDADSHWPVFEIDTKAANSVTTQYLFCEWNRATIWVCERSAVCARTVADTVQGRVAAGSVSRQAAELAQTTFGSAHAGVLDRMRSLHVVY